MSSCLMVLGHLQEKCSPKNWKCYLTIYFKLSGLSLITYHIWESITTFNTNYQRHLAALKVFIRVTSHESGGVSNHRKLDCLSNCLLNKNIKLCVTGPLWGESTGDRWFPSRGASNVESVHFMTSSWRHDCTLLTRITQLASPPRRTYAVVRVCHVHTLRPVSTRMG